MHGSDANLWRSSNSLVVPRKPPDYGTGESVTHLDGKNLLAPKRPPSVEGPAGSDPSVQIELLG